MKISHDSWLNRVLRCAGWVCFVLLVLITCIRAFYMFPGTSNVLTDTDIIQLGVATANGQKTTLDV